MGLWAGLSPETVADGLAVEPESPWRMELRRSPGGTTVLNDSYNAGPASMEAALRSLASLPAQRHVAVLGVMAELGERETAEHRRIAGLARDLGVELVPVATDLYGGEPVADAAVAVRTVRSLAASEGDGLAVLVKGSRVAGLEIVADALTATD